MAVATGRSARSVLETGATAIEEVGRSVLATDAIGASGVGNGERLGALQSTGGVAASSALDGPSQGFGQELEAGLSSPLADNPGEAAAVQAALEAQGTSEDNPNPTPMPTAPAGAAQAGVVTVTDITSAFLSARALGFIDLNSASLPTPAEIGWGVARRTVVDGAEMTAVSILDPWTKPADPKFTVKATGAGVLDTGQTISVTVRGQQKQVKKLVEVTADNAAQVARFEQQHIDDTVAAYDMVFPLLESAINYYCELGYAFKGESEDAAKAHGISRILDHVGTTRVGKTPAEWVAAYRSLLALTISQRDATGTHTWRLDSTPTISADGTSATFHLIAPTASAGPSFSVISWENA